jgi:predicted metal-dependent phosphoesterase TrpH
VHIVGLGFDADDPAMQQGLRNTRGGREQRAMEMSDSLAKVGIKGAYEGALKFVGNPELISRTHFARFLVETGVCRETPEVFRKYLTEGKPGYVPHRWANAARRRDLDHPGPGHCGDRPSGPLQVHPQRGIRLVQRVQVPWRARGGGCHRQPHPAEYVKYAETAKEFGLAASRGSDFHSPDESHTDLGTLPFLPGELTPVWELLADRIQ